MLNEVKEVTLEGVLRGLDIPEFSFKADEWNLIFLRGLIRTDFASKKVMEIGVGIGSNIAGLAKYHSDFTPKSIMFSDLDNRCIEFALRNIKKHLSYRTSLIPIFEEHDLFMPVKQKDNDGYYYRLREVDIIIGCLPQVTIPEDMDIENGDNLSHYYTKDTYKSKYHPWGLGLVDNCLAQAAELSDGKVILNISGRPSKEIIFEVFNKNGYSPSVVYEEIIPQCKSTSLKTYIDVEESEDTEFNFFNDPGGMHKLPAKEAEQLRLDGKNIYHSIYVIEGKKK